MSNIVFLGFPNQTEADYADPVGIGSIYEPAEMGSEWLKTDEPADKARKTTLDPYYSQWGFYTSEIPVVLDGMALVGHNVESGGQVRFLAWDDPSAGPPHLPTIKKPASVLASVNMTGAVGNIDESIDSPDGSTMAPTDPALPWSVHLLFATLTGTIDTRADMLALVVRVRRVFTGAGATEPITLPVLTAQLTAPTKGIGRRAVTNSALGANPGQILIFPFRLSDFTSVSDLRINLAFDPGISASGGQYAVLETAAVYYDTTGLGHPTFDTGWITITEDFRRARMIPARHSHHIPSTSWTNVTSYGVQVRTDQSIHDPQMSAAGWVPAGVVTTDPTTFIQAGVLPAGRAIIPANGVRRGGPGPMGGMPEVAAFTGVTAGGQSYGADAYGFRSSPPLELIVTRDELRLLQQLIGFQPNKPFYVAIEPGVAMEYQLFTAYWATLKSMGEPRPHGRYRADGSMRFTVEIVLQEKL